MAPRWTPQEDTLLQEIYQHNPKAEILSQFDKPWGTICRRARRLGLFRDKELIDEDRKKRSKTRNDSCQPEEQDLLKEIYEHNSKEYIISRFAPYGRSWQSIVRFAKILGLNRDPSLILKEMKTGGQKGADIIKWPENELAALKRVYMMGNKEDIMATLPGRTWKAIREQAVRLGLRRREGIINEERNKSNHKTIKERYGVNYSTQISEMQKKSLQTNRERRGVDYPTQSPEIREKVRHSVQRAYGVDNVFQSEKIKAKSRDTMEREYGAPSAMQVPEIRERAKKTNIEKYGVENSFQIVDHVQAGMVKNYGVMSPMQDPEILRRAEETNIQRYGFRRPAQNPEIRKALSELHKTDTVKLKKHLANKRRGHFESSEEENAFLAHLREIDPSTKPHRLHPILKHVMDYYMPKTDLWVQYDGEYWHGKNGIPTDGPQAENIRKIMKRDKLQNQSIPNLIRFWSGDVQTHIKNGSIIAFIEKTIEFKLKELKKKNHTVCHQYKKKMEWYEDDVLTLPFNPAGLHAKDFQLSQESLSDELVRFIEKYEWLGTVGNTPKWCFTAKHCGILGGVVLINEPNKYSHLLGSDTPVYEAQIQRGSTASWTPKNLGSRLIMFACRWMVNNTPKRAFVAFADPRAGERGIIYQACGFEYLGDNFGSGILYKHPGTEHTFTLQDLRRTQSFRRWCLENGIELKKEWFKDNGYKNLEKIPPDIKKAWYSWGTQLVESAEKIHVDKKSKYVLVIGKNKTEKKALQSLKTYTPQPYSRRFSTITSSPPTTRTGITRSRRNPKKINFLVKNHGHLTRTELAHELNETPRWVKRQIHRLIREGEIKKT